LSRVQGAGELQAVLLALLMAPDSKRALRAWQQETTATPGADSLRRHAASLSGAARLPWFELLLARMAVQPLAARQELLQATRRFHGRARCRPADRPLALADDAARPRRGRSAGGAGGTVRRGARVARIRRAVRRRLHRVPVAHGSGPNGRQSRRPRLVRPRHATWLPFAEIPEWQPPKAAAMVEALARMQTLSWRQRPVIVSNWVTSAISRSRGLRLGDLSADALRLTCGLLDSPAPPELARHYITLPADTAR